MNVKNAIKFALTTAVLPIADSSKRYILTKRRYECTNSIGSIYLYDKTRAQIEF